MAKFVVEVDFDKMDEEKVRVFIEEELGFNFSGLKVSKYDEKLPLDRLLGQLTNFYKSGEDSGLIKEWAKVVAKE
jgi:hypothetical protein